MISEEPVRMVAGSLYTSCSPMPTTIKSLRCSEFHCSLDPDANTCIVTVAMWLPLVLATAKRNYNTFTSRADMQSRKGLSHTHTHTPESQDFKWGQWDDLPNHCLDDICHNDILIYENMLCLSLLQCIRHMLELNSNQSYDSSEHCLFTNMSLACSIHVCSTVKTTGSVTSSSI